MEKMKLCITYIYIYIYMYIYIHIHIHIHMHIHIYLFTFCLQQSAEDLLDSKYHLFQINVLLLYVLQHCKKKKKKTSNLVSSEDFKIIGKGTLE